MKYFEKSWMVSYATPLGLLCPVMKAVSYTTPPGLLRTVRPPGSSGVNNFAKKCNQRDKNMNLRDLYHFGFIKLEHFSVKEWTFSIKAFFKRKFEHKSSKDFMWKLKIMLNSLKILVLPTRQLTRLTAKKQIFGPLKALITFVRQRNWSYSKSLKHAFMQKANSIVYS